MAKPASIDLHVHSTFSDGGLSPRQLAARARFNNVTAIAITDHDSLAGYEDKRAACDQASLECIPGVEISCEHHEREVHILSLFADPQAPAAERLDLLGRCRRTRMEKMLDKLGDMGIRLDLDELPVDANGVYGRPHLARALVAKRVVKSVNEAFARLLYDGGPVHIPKVRLPAAEGIQLAKDLGGVAVLAHPGVSGLLPVLDQLADLGLDGIESYHPKHGGETIARLLRYCRERGLLVSGGSDFHNTGDGPDIGGCRVPLEVLAPLRDAASSRKAG